MHVLQGAFLVNATVDATGSVSDVRLLAEAGGPCVFLSPWNRDDTDSKTTAPKVTCDGTDVVVKPASGPNSERQQAAENWFQYDTNPGDVCTISQ